jgi:putative Mg2+ transporter-C (MgtC) family protein
MGTTAALAAVSPAANTISGQGWRQVGELGLALLLSAVIGLEREWRGKDAGLRTHTLVGVGSALFMLISKYGFTDVLERQLIVLDPSRVAAQIVSGIGFVGAGLIFVHRGSVRGLTTAASIWVTAAVGAAAGAGLAVLAAAATGIYFLITLLLPILRQRLPVATGRAELRVEYPDGRGILRQVLNEITQRGFTVDELSTETSDDGSGDSRGLAANGSSPDGARPVTITMRVYGRRPVGELIAALSDLNYVHAVIASDLDAADD